MHHNVDGRKFGMNTSQRTAMFKVMANNLIQNEQMITTVAKAKEVRRVVDRLITLGKKGSLNAKRLVFARTRDRDTVVKVFSTLAERYAKRNGGYTRVLKVDGSRWGDGTEMAVIELVDRPMIEKKKKTKATPKAEGAEAGAEKPKKAAKVAKAPAGEKAQVSGAGKSKAAKTSAVRKSSSRGSGGAS